MNSRLWIFPALALVGACQGDRAWHEHKNPEIAFEQWLATWSEAPGLEARMTLRGFLPESRAAELPSPNPEDPPALMQQALLNFSMVKPAFGQMQLNVRARLLVGGDGSWQTSRAGIAADGTTLWAWDGETKTVWALGDSFADTASHMPDLAPLKAWAHLPQVPFEEVTWLDAAEQGPPAGLRVVRPNYVHEYRIGESGALLGVAMLPTSGPEALLPRFEFEIHYLELLAEVDPTQYTADPPPAYTKIVK